jgi:Flp pilus assembly protein TadD
MSSMSFTRPVLLAALAALTIAPAASADTPRRDRSAIADYVHARVADDLGELGVAAAGFAAAADGNPGNTGLALRAFRQSVAAGDMTLGLRMAHQLDASGSLPPDGTLLLLSESVANRNWKQAQALADRVDREKLFSFLTPVLRAWIAFGAKQGDPLALLDAASPTGLAETYAAEQRGLLLIATGKETAGVAALGALQLPDGARAARLRIAAAATLDQRHDRDAALAMLTGDWPAIARARAIVTAKHKLRGAVDTPATGIAELFVRVAADINKQQAAPLALHFARVATLLAPDDSAAWLVTASILSAGGAQDAALDALGHVAPDDPFTNTIRDARLTLLVRSGLTDQALAEAKAATTVPEAGSADWSRLADLYASNHRSADAAAAYGRALELAGGDKAPAEVAWPLLLQQANAQLEAGDWPSAKASAARALALAPRQPEVLNFFGYSEIEHGEDLDNASALIARASVLAPDDPSISDSLGWSWYLRGDVDRAIPLLERAAQGAPAESDINEHLGDAYWKANRRLAARYAWRAALVAADGEQATRLKAKIDFGLTAKP